MSIRIETITPKMAKRYLSTQLRNRKIKITHVNTLTRAMLEGKFLFSGDPIRFNKVGELIDGQHRLSACIRSGKNFDAIIVTDLEPEAQNVIDTGVKRGPGDIFGLRGYLNANHLTATLRWLWRFDTNQQISYGITPQISDLDAAMAKHPGVKDSLPIGIKCQTLVIKSLGAALHTLFSEKHPRDTNIFFDGLSRGEGLFKGDPVYMLRVRLLSNVRGKAKLPYPEVAALVIKAFNAHVKGRKVRHLRWTNIGETPEPFPEIE
jgi:hypothetical protein